MIQFEDTCWCDGWHSVGTDSWLRCFWDEGCSLSSWGRSNPLFIIRENKNIRVRLSECHFLLRIYSLIRIAFFVFCGMRMGCRFACFSRSIGRFKSYLAVFRPSIEMLQFGRCRVPPVPSVSSWVFWAIHLFPCSSSSWYWWLCWLEIPKQRDDFACGFHKATVYFTSSSTILAIFLLSFFRCDAG